MKKNYQNPTVDLYILSTEDVIATSGPIQEDQGSGDVIFW